MKSRIYTVIIIIFSIVIFAGCAGKSTHIDKDYTLQTVDSTKHNRIKLDDYKIANSGMISLKDIIKLNNMNIECVSFYDSDNLIVLCTDSEYTRIDIYTFSLDYGILQWMGAVEGIAKYQEAEYSIAKMSPLIIHEKKSNIFWVVQEKAVQNEINLDVEYNRTSVVGNKYIYFTDSDANVVKRVDFITGEEEVFFEDIESYSYSVRNLEYISEDGKYLYVTGVNKISLQDVTCVIDTKTGKMVAGVNGRYQCWESDDAIYAGFYENTVYNIHQRIGDDYTNVNVAKISPSVAYESCIFEKDTIITVETDGKKYTFQSVDLKNMTMEYMTEIDMNAYYMSAFSEECNYSYCVIDKQFSYNSKRDMFVFEVISDLGRRNIFLWDVDSGTEIMESVSADGYSETVNDHVIQLVDYGKVSEMVQSIYEEYGVAIYIGENVPHTFVDYRVEMMGDISAMLDAVKSIKKVLGYYPRDFFREFVTNDYSNGMCIYLVGDMTPLSEEYIINPAGFATNMQHYEIIALNINDITYIDSNLCHEIAHAIHKRIKYQEIYSGDVYLDMEEWEKLNPKGFKYYNSYEDSYEKNIEYTGEAYSETMDLKNVYFVDAYSKTMIEEDFARLMEYGMIRYDEPYLESQNIKNKMKYFYQAIRKVWKTGNWPEETIWERTAK